MIYDKTLSKKSAFHIGPLREKHISFILPAYANTQPMASICGDVFWQVYVSSAVVTCFSLSSLSLAFNCEGPYWISPFQRETTDSGIVNKRRQPDGRISFGLEQTV